MDYIMANQKQITLETNLAFRKCREREREMHQKHMQGDRGKGKGLFGTIFWPCFCVFLKQQQQDHIWLGYF